MAVSRQRTCQPMPDSAAGFWGQVGDQRYFAMVTCDANTGWWRRYTRKRLITILRPDDHERWLAYSYDDVLAGAWSGYVVSKLGCAVKQSTINDIIVYRE